MILVDCAIRLAWWKTPGFAAIEEAVYGEDHFLGSQHTMDAMQWDYF